MHIYSIQLTIRPIYFVIEQSPAPTHCLRSCHPSLIYLRSLSFFHLMFSLTPHISHITQSITRGHNLKIHPPLLYYYALAKQNFLSRTASTWNSLPHCPHTVLNAPSTASFRCHVSLYLTELSQTLSQQQGFNSILV